MFKICSECIILSTNGRRTKLRLIILVQFLELKKKLREGMNTNLFNKFLKCALYTFTSFSTCFNKQHAILFREF